MAHRSGISRALRGGASLRPSGLGVAPNPDRNPALRRPGRVAAGRGAGADAAPDLTLVYLQGTDSIGHVFAPFAPPRQPSVPEPDFDRYRDVPEHYFREVDALLGRLLALADRAQLDRRRRLRPRFPLARGPAQQLGKLGDADGRSLASPGGHLAGAFRGGCPGESGEGKATPGLPDPARTRGIARGSAGERQPLGAVPPPTEPTFDYAAVFRQLAARSRSRPGGFGSAGREAR